jgi:hypothetical protein
MHWLAENPGPRRIEIYLNPLIEAPDGNASVNIYCRDASDLQNSKGVNAPTLCEAIAKAAPFTVAP